MIYSQSQWLLYFFFYSFAGWVWESGYVSLRQRHWVNRGFLHGPALPIYGFGAILVLWLTLPLQGNWPLVYMVGMVGASALEFLTGAAMERLFHVRYWDYSNILGNLQGHICLPVSLLWGVFSVVLVRFGHPPVERLVTAIPLALAEPLSLGLALIFALDTYRSVQAALDLRELLGKLASSNEELALLEEKLGAALSTLSSAPQRLRERRQELLPEGRALQERVQTWLEQRSQSLQNLAHGAESALGELNARLTQAEDLGERRRLSRLSEDLQQLRLRVERAKQELAQRREKEYSRALALLRRNPTARESRLFSHHRAGKK